MRELIFRRCRLEIEPSGVVRIVRDGVTATMTPPPADDRMVKLQAAAHGYDDVLRFHIDYRIAAAWLFDLFDKDFAGDDDLEHLLKNEPLPAAGQWDEMSRFWFQRVLAGWPVISHTEALNASTWTSFLASAIKADRDADNRNEGRNAPVDAANVGRADGLVI
jgi:hypothetical protein